MPLLTTLVSFLTFLSKPQRTFLRRLLLTLCLCTGRATQLQIARLHGPSPRSQARWAQASFDFPRIALTFLRDQGILQHRLVAVLDATFLFKSGKHTWGKAPFWNGCQSRVMAGREVSVLGLLDCEEDTAWPIDARQTPATLTEESSRMTFYLKQVQELKPRLPPSVTHLVVDAAYTRKGFVDGIRALEWQVVGKLRKDANLRIPYAGPPALRGRPKKWAGKVNVKDLATFQEVTPLSSGEEVRTQVVYHQGLERLVRVVGVRTDTGAFTLLFSTDLALDPLDIVRLYRLRFQIEFVFRDSKQHTGFGEDQVRSKEKQALHHQAALIATTVARLEERQRRLRQPTRTPPTPASASACGKTPKKKQGGSVGMLKRQLHNRQVGEQIFRAQGLDPAAPAQQRILEHIQNFGCMAA